MNDFLIGFALAGVGFLMLSFTIDYAHRCTAAEVRERHQIDLDAWAEVFDRATALRYQAEANARIERAARYKAEQECNRFRTAFRGEMTRQARAELIRPDELVEVGKVLTFTATSRGGRRAR